MKSDNFRATFEIATLARRNKNGVEVFVTFEDGKTDLSGDAHALVVDLMTVVKAETGYTLRRLSVDLNRQRIILNGELAVAEVADRLANTLSTNPRFKKVTPKTIVYRGTALHFGVTVDLQGRDTSSF